MIDWFCPAQLWVEENGQNDEDKSDSWVGGVSVRAIEKLPTKIHKRESRQSFFWQIFYHIFHSASILRCIGSWGHTCTTNSPSLVSAIQLLHWPIIWCTVVMSMFVSSKWQYVVLPTCWRASVRALFYCYLTFLDHRTNIPRKVSATRQVSASWAPNKF